MKTWKTLLLIYRELDVSLRVRRESKHDASADGRLGNAGGRFHHFATEPEITDALDSFAGFPKLVRELTNDRARIEEEIVHVDHALISLTRESSARFWPSPEDVRAELNQFGSAGKYDSIFVFWPQRNLKEGTAVPCDAWGLAVGASEWTNWATYAAIANAPSSAWANEACGEVWLHEWLHGVCAHFSNRSHIMPERDADGGEVHGYVRSPTHGWTDYYRDLMNGDVLEDGKRFGIPREAWV